MSPERLLHRPLRPTAVTRPILEGIPREPKTREQFANSQHVDLEPAGFVASDDGKLGCAPEARIKGRQDGPEINVLTAPVHVGYRHDVPLV